MRRLLPLTLCLLAIAPAAAQAQDDPTKIRVYKVTAEGSGHFKRDQIIPSGFPGLTHDIHRNMTFSWNVKLPSVAFFPDGRALLIGYADGAVSGTVTRHRQERPGAERPKRSRREPHGRSV